MSTRASLRAKWRERVAPHSARLWQHAAHNAGWSRNNRFTAAFARAWTTYSRWLSDYPYRTNMTTCAGTTRHCFYCGARVSVRFNLTLGAMTDPRCAPPPPARTVLFIIGDIVAQCIEQRDSEDTTIDTDRAAKAAITGVVTSGWMTPLNLRFLEYLFTRGPLGFVSARMVPVGKRTYRPPSGRPPCGCCVGLWVSSRKAEKCAHVGVPSLTRSAARHCPPRPPQCSSRSLCSTCGLTWPPTLPFKVH